MLQRRMTIAAIAGFLLVAAVPALGADAPSPNDTARFLAGLPPAADSPLAALTKDAGWQQHANAFNASFQRVDQEQIAKIRTWSAAHLTESRPTMFYMFSGPDFLYANAFYPKAKTYVFAGLEPAGEVPDLTTLRGSLAPGPVAPAEFAAMDPAAQLLHHEPDGVGSAPRSVPWHVAGLAGVHVALRQDHS